MNIKDYNNAIELTYCATISADKTVVTYIYYIPTIGMLYEVTPADGNIIAQKYILDIAFSPITQEP